MKRIRRTIGFLCVAALLMMFSGCAMIGADVETQLRPPRGTGEQEKIQTALETYIQESGNSKTGYGLKYPKSGDNRSAFIVEDFDRDGKEEAFAFYYMGPENLNTHVNYLRIIDGNWVSVDDVEGLSVDISQVFIGDLDGTGTKTLCVGWEQYGSLNKEMCLYTPGIDSLTGRKLDTYSCAVVDDILTQGNDDILLFQIRGNNEVTAQLWSQYGGSFSEMDTIRLDGFIQSFSNPHVVDLNDSMRGVFVDGYRSEDVLVTELVYWDGDGLSAPLYDPNLNKTECSERSSGIPSMDIDGDGMIEWPTSRRMNGYGAQEIKDALWVTSWWTWDHEAVDMKYVQREFDSFINLSDRYCLRATDAFFESVTAEYDESNRVLTLRTFTANNQAGDPVMKIRASSSQLTQASEEQSNVSGEKYNLLMTVNGISYSVWLDSASGITMESARYMLTVLPGQKA